MNIKTLVCAACMALFTITPGQAVTLSVVGGQLTGASSVNVGGSFFDVEFLDGSCNAIFSGCNDSTDLNFSSLAAATVAAQSLLDQVFVGLFDTQPGLTAGINTGTSLAFTYIPFQLTGSNVKVAQVENSVTEANDRTSDTFLPTGFSSAIFSTATYARFTPSQVSPVPLPPGIVLFLTGLAGLAGIRRWKERAA